MSCADLDLNSFLDNKTTNLHLSRMCPWPEDTSQLLSQKTQQIGTAQILSIMLLGCLGTICLFVGIGTNTTAIYRLRKLRNRLPLHNYMILLYIWDNALLLTSWFWLCLPSVTEDKQQYSGTLMLNSLPYGLTLLHFNLTGVIWVNLLIAVERSIVITRPSSGTAQKMNSRFKKAIPILIFGSIILNIPRFFELNIYTCCDVIKQKLITKAASSNFVVRGGPYFWLYTVIGRSLFVTVTPVVATALLTLYTVRQAANASCFVQNAANQSESTEKSSANQKALYRIYRYTTFIVIKFVICHGICSVCDIVECIFEPAHTENINYFDVLKEFSSLLVMLHSATDGVFYLRDKCILFGEEQVSSASSGPVKYKRCASENHEMSKKSPKYTRPYAGIAISQQNTVV